MQEVFKDRGIQQRLSEQGFVTFPILTAEEIDDLKEFYRAQQHLDHKGTNVSMFNPSYEYRSQIDAHIKKVCADKINELLSGYHALYANYMVKENGPEGDFPIHQDWTYVDESKYTTIAFWIPLHDVDENNGALHVVPGSHRFLTRLRGPYIYEPFQQFSKVIKEKYSQAIPLKAGEAIAWDHRLIHFSLSNRTFVPRMAVTLIMVPQGTTVIHCYALPESNGTTIEKYEVSTDFFMRYRIGQPPGNVPLIETTTQPNLNFDENQFEEMYQNANRRPVL